MSMIKRNCQHNIFSGDVVYTSVFITSLLIQAENIPDTEHYLHSKQRALFAVTFRFYQQNSDRVLLLPTLTGSNATSTESR